MTASRTPVWLFISSRLYSQLGQRVEAVRAAFQFPEAPGLLTAVVQRVHGPRFSVMVRGRPAWQLQVDSSILEASGYHTREYINARINLIKMAIRAIDLE